MLNIWILNRFNKIIKSFNRCFAYEINRDYLTNEISTFNIEGNFYAEKGDFLIAKLASGLGCAYGADVTKPFYFGVIDSFENNLIKTCGLYNIVNFEFPATRKTGNAASGGFGRHIEKLLRNYLHGDNSKLGANINLKVDPSAKVAYSYQPKDPPTPTNLVKYLINGFKKYNITWEVDGLLQNYDNSYIISTIIKRKDRIIRLKNNNYSFVNFDVYVNDTGRNLENQLIIVNKTTRDSERPVVLAKYYLTKDSEITQTINENIYKPTKDKVCVYDTTQEDRPTFDEVAQSELKGNNYSHEINFDIIKNNNIFSLNDLEIGLIAEIMHDNTIYKSLLTGYTISNENDFIHLKFGHIRSTLQAIIYKN